MWEFMRHEILPAEPAWAEQGERPQERPARRGHVDPGEQPAHPAVLQDRDDMAILTARSTTPTDADHRWIRA
jgi:hypothetical protein